jgi:hypothetical protein
MTLNQTLAGKCGRDDQGAEMLTISFDFEMGAIKISRDIVFDQFGSGQHGFAFV